MVSEKTMNPSQTAVQSQPTGVSRRPSMEKPNPPAKNFEKRIVSKSDQKVVPKLNEKPSTASEC